MKASQNLVNKLIEWEGLRLKSYQDTKKVWTIGIGSTMYPTGKHVGPRETITRLQADQLLIWELNNKADAVNKLLKGVTLTQNQFDALLSFAFNTGTGIEGFAGSTLLKRVRANPKDPTIQAAFMMWDKIHLDGKLVSDPGLKNRRIKEWTLYNSK